MRLHVTHVPGHFLTLEHATRCLALTDRARRAVRQRVTVRGILHVEIVTFDATGETFTDGGSANIDLLTGLENIHTDLVADFGYHHLHRRRRNSHRPRPASTPALAKCPAIGLGDPDGATRTSVTWNARIAVSFVRFVTWVTRLGSTSMHRDRDGRTVFGEDAGHSCFFAYYPIAISFPRQS